ncbi:MAG: zinc ABC transporter substrate-binding protein [Phycisphaerales bacterium]|nr:zinc ABC transporter substrate-binding protein [Phycisphaerales bacterium]
MESIRTLAGWAAGWATLLALSAPVPGHAQDTTRPARLKVAVTIAPQAYFVERIGGEHVEVTVVVGPGQSPHAYEPTPRQVAALEASQLYFTIGIEVERALVPKLRGMFKNMEFVDTRRGIALRRMTAAELHADCDHGHEQAPRGRHEHGDGAVHDHFSGAPDPHIWMNPRLVKIQAQTITEALSAADGARAELYKLNLAAFERDLDAVHAEIAAVLQPFKGREVFVFHPAYGYFLDEFGLKQVPVEVDGKQPSSRQLAMLIDRARAAGVKVIFVEPQFSPRSAKAVADAIDGVVVTLDPLARDYLVNLRSITLKIRDKFESPVVEKD